MNTEEAFEKLRQSPHQVAQVGLTDVDGVLRGKFMSREKLLTAMRDGFGFCDVVFGWDMADECYENADFTGWHTGYPDATVRIDPTTYRSVPWNENLPFFLGDFRDQSGQPLGVCPRGLLTRIVEQARRLGFSVKCGLEYEWFNFRESPEGLAARGYTNPATLTTGMFGYSILRLAQNQDYCMSLVKQLNSFGVPLEGLHTETGPGVFEGAVSPSDAVEAADRGVLFKMGVKAIAHNFGILPSFMAKWNSNLPGCSAHVHQSLISEERNVFFDNEKIHGISELMGNYIAGQLHCLPEILPFFAPTVNSYKRLVEGLWAPTRVAWGVENRTAALRGIPGGEKSTRLETRVPGSDVNPYLALAAAIASGLYGIRNGMKPPLPISGNAYRTDAESLPKDLKEATDRLADSALARELFGDSFVEHFVQTRRWEWNQFMQNVTSWELQRYFEIV